jgi:hypothetical protein
MGDNMKNKITVGLIGKLHGLHRKLLNDLPALGLTPFEMDRGDLAHPPGTAAVIFTCPDLHPDLNQRGKKEPHELSVLIESLRDDQVQLIFVSIAATNQPETLVTSFGHLDLKAETLIRESGIPYTIVRVMSAEDRPGHHHKLFWKQGMEGKQKGSEHPVPWEDLARVLAQCVNRPKALSRTFTVHAVTGTPNDNWDQWFQGLNPDAREKSGRKTA